MKLRVAFLVVLSVLVIPVAFGQALTVGVDVATPNSSDSAIAVTRTDISLNNPATATGTVASVKVYWSALGCANAFKVKFFRRVGDTLTLITERGPFTSSVSATYAMSPPVGVEQGDLIGVARVANCGNSGTLVGIVSAGYLVYSGDVSGSVAIADAFRAGGVLSAYGTGTAAEAIGDVLPVVGSATGTFGSSFKTSMQLLNPGSSTIIGRLVFHRAGVAGSSSDTSFTYTILGNQVLTLPDLGTSIGTTGTGSLDVIVATGMTRPQMVTRIYNDAGTAAGTAGFFEDPITPADLTVPGGRVVSQGSTAFMLTPVEPARTRLNIGVRTFFSGASLSAQLLDNVGHVLASVTKTYTATYFEQVDSTSFFGGVPIGANQIIKISVSDGSAIIYGATTDNVTNDPSVQYAIVAFAIL